MKPASTHVTSPLRSPSGSIIPNPLFSSVTGSSVPNSKAAVPTRTRTITVSTATPVILTIMPTQTGDSLVDPTVIDGWTLLGCFGSLASHQSFTQAASFPTMDNQACVTSCAGHKYAGVSGEYVTPFFLNKLVATYDIDTNAYIIGLATAPTASTKPQPLQTICAMSCVRVARTRSAAACSQRARGLLHQASPAWASCRRTRRRSATGQSQRT